MRLLSKVSSGILLMGIVALSSCSKDDGGGTPTPGDDNPIKTAKITITITGGNSRNLNVTIAGVNTAAETNVWKVDGAAPGNDAAVTFNSEDFPGTGSTTHTIELAKAVNNFGFNIYAGVLSGGTNYKLYYKVVVNGVTKDEVTTNITASTDYSKSLRYTQ